MLQREQQKYIKNCFEEYTIFWDITPCSLLEVNRRFEGTHRLHLPICFHAGFFPCSVYSSALKMEAVCSSEKSVDFQRTIRRYIPEASPLRNLCLRILHPIIFVSIQWRYKSLQIWSHYGYQTAKFRTYFSLYFIKYTAYKSYWGTRYRSWLSHYGTSRMVAGSIPDEAIGLFNLPNPSNRTTALGLTQPLTEMSTRNLPRS
jgi:hypothetical protein